LGLESGIAAKVFLADRFEVQPGIDQDAIPIQNKGIGLRRVPDRYIAILA
jgi:hypothetical protein